MLVTIFNGALTEAIQPYVGRHGEFAAFNQTLLGAGAVVGFPLGKICMSREAGA